MSKAQPDPSGVLLDRAQKAVDAADQFVDTCEAIYSPIDEADRPGPITIRIAVRKACQRVEAATALDDFPILWAQIVRQAGATVPLFDSPLFNMIIRAMDTLRQAAQNVCRSHAPGTHAAEDMQDALADATETVRRLHELQIALRGEKATDLPEWNGSVLELKYRGWTKRYKRNAESQIDVLNAFQAKGWARSISSDDIVTDGRKGVIGERQFKDIARHIATSFKKGKPRKPTMRITRGGAGGLMWEPVGE